MAILQSLLDAYRTNSLELETCKEKERRKKARLAIANIIMVVKRWLKLDWMLLEDPGTHDFLDRFIYRFEIL